MLRAAARPVEDPTAPWLRRLVEDMVETMEDAGGTGLAAPQVHVPPQPSEPHCLPEHLGVQVATHRPLDNGSPRYPPMLTKSGSTTQKKI